MGNQKFKLSDMIPNAWFYKLKDMNKNSKSNHSTKLKKHNLPPPPAPPSSPPISTAKTLPQPELETYSRKSYHITRELTNELPKGLDTLLLLHSPSRKSKSSTKGRKSTKRRSSSTSSCSCRSSMSSQSHHSKSRSPPSPSPPMYRETDVLVKKLAKNGGFLFHDALLISKQSIIDCDNALPKTAEHYDIDIDVDEKSLGGTNNNKISNFKFQLPPIITKQQITKPNTKNSINDHKQLNPPIMKEQRNSPPSRRFSVSSPRGLRLKISSPKIAAKKQGQNGNYISSGRKSTSSKKRRSVTESFAVVKTSRDPQRDFRESMVEMIVQNNLSGSKDLEDLLACYLSLNSDEYHEIIIKVFKQLWFDLRHHK